MRNASHSDVTLIKERIGEKIVALNKEIDTCDNEEALSTLEKQLGAAYSTFTAVKKYGRSILGSTQLLNAAKLIAKTDKWPWSYR